MAQADLSFLSERVQRALAADEEVLGELRRFDDDYADLQRLVRDLPNRTSHEVMVPFTDVAFFPGRLIHTNEFLVLLGSDLYAERSATQTLDIIERRRDMLREKIQGASARVDAMSSRVGALDAVSAADGGLGVIPEEEGEDDAPGAFTTRREGRADITRKPNGTVEITETYADGETLDPIEARRASSAPAAPAPAPGTRFRRRDGPTRGARGGRRRRPASARARSEPKPHPDDRSRILRRVHHRTRDGLGRRSGLRFDYDENDAAAEKVAAANAEANARAAAAAARRIDDAAAAVRRRAAVKNVVEERRIDTRRTDATIDIAGSAASAPDAPAARPMSAFKRRALGLEADPRDELG